jgi:uncharacterized protein (TIGR02453 family)
MAKRKPAATTTESFAGFDKSAMGFWHELAAEMNKEWFAENKQRYETLWVQPMSALMREVGAKLAKSYGSITLADPKVMRIHRDVRFSKDPSPYKTHIGAVIAVAGKGLAQGGNAAMYMHLGIDEEFAGVGCYMFDPAKLAKWRKQVAGKSGEELAKIVGKLRGKGYVVGGHDDLKKVPKPYDADHPRGELLRMKGLTGGFPSIPKGLIHKAGMTDWLVEHGRAMVPLITWLQAHVG